MMACKEWNDQWVARLYDELDADESRRADQHLASCAECREAMEGLAGASQLLRESAPETPVAPRLVVLQPRRFQQPAWAFVAGLATAAVLVLAALSIAPRPAGELTGPTTQAAASSDVAALNARLTELERSVESNRQQVDVEMARWARRVDVERAGDVDFLLNEISAVERRTGNYINNNREHILQATLNTNNPGLRQH
jgi:anti-sigma factor RsiW